MLSFVVYLSPTEYGKEHDKTIADRSLYYSKPIEMYSDLGFYGYKPDNVNIQMPHKKPKNAELTKIQKTQNRLLSRKRIKVENTIGSVKIMRIVKDKNRNRKQGYRDLVMDNAVALHNFRITKRNTIYL